MNDYINVSQLLSESGIPESNLILLLMIPVVVTLVSFARHIIGMRIFGIFTTTMLTFAYYELGAVEVITERSDLITGLKYGLTLTIIILATTLFTHVATRKIRLHYLPKLSIVITVTSFVVMFSLLFGGIFKRLGFVAVDIFPVFIISTISEDFIRSFNKSKANTAYLTSIQTLVVAVISYIIIAYRPFQDLMLTYPWAPFLAIAVNFGIGKFTGLRITEYFRFRDILLQDETGADPEK